MKVKALNCPNCGATIHKYQNFCEYCGSGLSWEDDLPIIKVETYSNPVETLRSRFAIDEVDARHIGPEGVAEIAMNTMTRDLSRQMAQFMVTKNEFDIARHEYIFTSEVKVVRPKKIW